jgi:glycosyltransferase involved in cell wall biosynthesis
MIKKARIVWARDILLDVHLHKTTEIGILQQLAEEDFEIFFLSAYSKKRNIFQNPNLHNYSIHVGSKRLISRMIFTLTQLFYFPFLMLKAKPNFVVVDEDSIFGLIPSIPLFKLIKTKLIFDIRSTPTPVENTVKKTKVSNNLLSYSFSVSVMLAKRALDGMTVLTDLMREEVCARFNIDRNWAGVWTSGVSDDLYNPEGHRAESNSLRKELGLSGQFLVSYHGGFTQSRGLIDAIMALATIKDQYPEVSLFFLGSGSECTLTEMHKIISESKLENRVCIHGTVGYAEVPKYLGMCDVGIIPLPDLPQWRNQCPLKLLEYLAMKKPVIVTDIPGNRAVIGASECGIYTSTTQPSELARAMVFAYENRQDLNRRGELAREIVEDNYTWKRVAERLESYLEKLLKSK